MLQSLVGKKVVPIPVGGTLREVQRELQWGVKHPSEVVAQDAEHIYCGALRFYTWELLSREEVGDILGYMESIDHIEEELIEAEFAELDEVAAKREEELAAERGNFQGYVNDILHRMRQGIEPEEVYTA